MTHGSGSLLNNGLVIVVWAAAGEPGAGENAAYQQASTQGEI
jgi:hypothetical protein